MGQTMLFRVRICSAAVIAFVLIAGEAGAQFTRRASDPPQSSQQAPPGAVDQLPDQLTPDQIKDILLLRALQSRGRSSRGVRTGVPQFVPFGNPGLSGFPVLPMQNAQPQATNKSSAKKRTEARAARDEKNRIAREKAKAKREQATTARAKARAEARAKAEANAKDVEEGRAQP
ncbi:MAG: hypothetical protein WD063_14345 [Pirellulales bacterium]